MEVLDKKICGFPVYGEQLFAFFRAIFVKGKFPYLNACLFRNDLHCFIEGEGFMFHQEADNIATGPASETMEYLFWLTYHEGWSFLSMKGTEGFIVLTGFF